MSSRNKTEFDRWPLWQDARQLARRIYTISSQGSLAADFTLSSHLRESAVDVASRLAEAFEQLHSSSADQALNAVRLRIAEMRSLLHVAHDVNVLDDKDFEELATRAEDLADHVKATRQALRSTAGGDRPGGGSSRMKYGVPSV